MRVCCEHAASLRTESGHMQVLASNSGRQGCTSCGGAWQWQDLWLLASHSAMAAGKAGTCAATAVQGAGAGAHKVGFLISQLLSKPVPLLYTCPNLLQAL